MREERCFLIYSTPYSIAGWIVRILKPLATTAGSSVSVSSDHHGDSFQLSAVSLQPRKIPLDPPFSKGGSYSDSIPISIPIAIWIYRVCRNPLSSQAFDLQLVTGMSSSLLNHLTPNAHHLTFFRKSIIHHSSFITHQFSFIIHHSSLINSLSYSPTPSEGRDSSPPEPTPTIL